MVNAKKQELIEELKALRLEKGYTYQQIADETELLGHPVSLKKSHPSNKCQTSGSLLNMLCYSVDTILNNLLRSLR